MKQTSGKGVRFAKRLYALRRVGLGIGFFCVAAVFYEQQMSVASWLLLVFHGFLWPHLAYRIALRSAIPYRGERRNLMIDAAFGGLWIVAMRFNIVPSAVIIAMLSMDNIAAGGMRLFVRGLGAHLIGALIGIAVFGFSVAPETSMVATLVCLPMLMLYPLALGKMTYDVSQKLAVRSRELETANQHDGLTGLLNRSYWETLLEREFAWCREHARISCLVLLDLDHFKRVNDTHGHLIGDEVLKKFSTLLLTHTRATDRIGRYGGEEFGIILSNTNQKTAGDIIQRLLEAIRAQITLNDSLRGCTASVGLVSFAADFESHQVWLQEADRSLYQAKNQGRDCCVVREPT